MKSKIILTFFVLIFASIFINAQKHDNSEGACKLFRNVAKGDGASCPACMAILKKELAARDAEDKRRQDVITKKRDAERRIEEAEYQKQMALREANRKVTEVKVVMPKSKPDGTVKTPSKKGGKTIVSTKGVFKGKLYPVSANSDFGVLLNSKGDTIIKSNEFKTVMPSSDTYKIEDMPDNLAIVEYRFLLDSEYPDSQFYPMNLINSEMKKILSDEKINFIEYAKNNLFLVASGGSYTDGLVARKIYMYDHQNHKITPIDNVTSELTYSPINSKGVDMTDYYDLKILASNDVINGKSKYLGSYSPELDKIYENSGDWLLLLSQAVGYKYATPKYKYYYVDKDRNLVSVGISERN